MTINLPKTSDRPCRRARLKVGRGLLAASIALITAGSPLVDANASVVQPTTHQVLHYFSKFESQVFLTEAGKPFSPSEKSQPAPGDSIEGTNLDYLGDNGHHAATWTASDHELCILDNQGNPVCHAPGRHRKFDDPGPGRPGPRVGQHNDGDLPGDRGHRDVPRSNGHDRVGSN